MDAGIGNHPVEVGKAGGHVGRTGGKRAAIGFRLRSALVGAAPGERADLGLIEGRLF